MSRKRLDTGLKRAQANNALIDSHLKSIQGAFNKSCQAHYLLGYFAAYVPIEVVKRAIAASETNDELARRLRAQAEQPAEPISPCTGTDACQCPSAQATGSCEPSYN